MQEPQEVQVQSLGWEDPLEKEIVAHSSILAWRIPWTEQPGGLWSMGLQRVRHAEHRHHMYVCRALSLLWPTLCDPTDCSPPGSSAHGDYPGQNTGVGCHALLQGIFPTQGLNPGLPHCSRILHCLSLQGSPHVYVMYTNSTV